MSNRHGLLLHFLSACKVGILRVPCPFKKIMLEKHDSNLWVYIGGTLTVTFLTLLYAKVF